MANRQAGIKAKLHLDAQSWGATIGKAEGQFKNFTNKIKSAPALDLKAPRVTAFNSALVKTAAAAGVAGVAIKSMFSADKNLEGMIRGLAAVSNGTESVREQMDALSKVAAAPGIDLEGAVQGSIALQAVGLSAKESRQQLSEWANVVASANGSAEDFKGVMVAVRQILSKPVVQADDIAQILDRVPSFAGINAKLADKKADSRAFIDGALVELQKLPRVVAGAQESVDNLADAWAKFKSGVSGGKVGAVISGTANALSDILGGRKSFGQAFTDMGEGLATEESDPVKKYELSAEDAAKRRAQSQEAAHQKEVSRRENVIKLLTVANDEDRQKFDLAMAHAVQDADEVARLESALELERQIREVRKEVGKIDDDQIAAMEKAAALRRQDARMIREAAAATANARDQRNLEIAGARHMGRNRRADRLEDAQKVEDLVRAGTPEADAKKRVREQRDFADDEKLGPGRRRIRSLPAKAPTSALPERGNVTLPPADILPARAPMPDTTPRTLPRKVDPNEAAREAVRNAARGADAATGGRAPGSDAILKEMNGNLAKLVSATMDNAKTAAERMRPVRST